MTELLIHTENRKNHYLFCVGYYEDETYGFLDITTAVKSAQKRDKTNGYKNGNGPNTAQEILKAKDYAEYVSMYATSNNLSKFGVEGREWYCYTSVLNPTQFNDIKTRC